MGNRQFPRDGKRDRQKSSNGKVSQKGGNLVISTRRKDKPRSEKKLDGTPRSARQSQRLVDTKLVGGRIAMQTTIGGV